MSNNRAEDITDEPRPRRVCAKCGEIAHYPELCYGEKPATTICKKCGRPTGKQRVWHCDDCVSPNALIKRRAHVSRAA